MSKKSVILITDFFIIFNRNKLQDLSELVPFLITVLYSINKILTLKQPKKF